MTAAEFAAAIDTLGWSGAEAARILGLSSDTRVSEWRRGHKAVPAYIAASVRAHLRLARVAETVAAHDVEPTA